MHIGLFITMVFTRGMMCYTPAQSVTELQRTSMIPHLALGKNNYGALKKGQVNIANIEAGYLK